MKKNKLPRIAFVKAATCRDFYTQPDAPALEMLLTSFKPGPFALYTECGADFFIVRDSGALECRAWKETAYYGKKTFAHFRAARQHAREQEARGVVRDLAQIDWNAYDIVISFYIAVPSRIVRRHPRILWCYYHWVPCPTYLLSKKHPLFGYNIFVNQWLSYGPLSDPMRERIRTTGKGQINFPATFLAADTFSRLYPVRKRSGIQVEPRSVLLINDEERAALAPYGPLRERAPFPDFFRQLCSSRYFVVLQKKMSCFRGNGFIEASSAGCLILAPRDCQVVHDDLILDECRYDGLADLVQRLSALEKSPARYRKLLEKQRQYHQRHVFDLPLQELLEAHRHFVAGREQGFPRRRLKDACAYLLYLFNNFFLNRLYRLFRGLLALCIRPFTRRDPEDFISYWIRRLFGDIF